MIINSTHSMTNQVLKTAIGAEIRLPDQQTDIFVLHGECGIQWNLDSEQHYYLYKRIKRLNGNWNGRFWALDSQDRLDEFMAFPAQKKEIRDYKIIQANQQFAGTVITAVRLNNGAGYFYQNHPEITRQVLEYTWIPDSKLDKPNWWSTAPTVIPSEFENVLAKLVERGATVEFREHDALPVTIRAQGRITQLMCRPVDDPSHYLIREALADTWKWSGYYPHGIKTSLPWDGIISMPAHELDEWLEILQDNGIQYEFEQVNADKFAPISLDYAAIPGWSHVAPNGKKLHQYQREGIEFAADKQGRILNADEMGTGKTVQSIGFAQGVHAERIFIVVPSNARYVWEREIREWIGPDETIQHITTSMDVLNENVRWVIATYDVLVARGGTIIVSEEQDKKIFIEAGKNNKKLTIQDLENGSVRVSISKKLDIIGLSENTVQKLDKINQRLCGRLVTNLSAAAFDLLIVDEAHYLKNPGAKRTKSVARLAEHIDQKLLLSGTPIRNKAEEAISLLNILCPDAKKDIEFLNSSSTRNKIALTRSFLRDYMIRRTKTEVLTQLPPKIRDWVEVVPDLENDETYLFQHYQKCIELAGDNYRNHLRTAFANDANDYMHNAVLCIEQARTILGKIKVFDGELASYIKNVIDQKGACIVFCAHHAVSDKLSAQLNSLNISNTIVDGRTTKQLDRKAAEEDFQNGNISVFIGGIRAAGESITLTRSDICIFVESDWVPAAMMQAEDRGHRIGQASNGYQIVHWVVNPSSGIKLDKHITDLLRRKIEVVDMVLDEKSDFKFSKSDSDESIKTSLMRAMFGE